MKQLLIVGMVAATAVAVAETVTLAPAEGVTNNVLQVYSGDTELEIAGPGTVKLNPANAHTGGTTLSGGTLLLSGNISGGSHSPVGAGTFTVAGGTLRGSGTFGGNINATAAATLAGDGMLTLTGNNTFAEPLTISEGTIEVAGGTTTLGKHLYLLPAGDEPVGYLQSGGSVTMGANNLQFSYKAGSSSSFTMTGGSFDVNGKNALVGYDVANASATVDISGGAALRNIGNFYTHTKSGNSLAVSVRDGGTLGFGSIYNSSSDGALSLHVDGGTLANDTTGISSARTTSNSSGWIRNNITSFKVGPGGATFTTDNGAGAGLAQIRMPILAEAAGEGETAKGVIFKTGDWGYYVAGNDYEGPTVIRKGAALFLYSNGTIPSGSVVTVASGGELCVCGSENKPKTVSSLVLQDGAILGFGLNLNTLTASESVTLPSHAKIALYNNANPTTGKNNGNGTYVVLKVPAAYEAALRAVHWSCATATSGKSYTFSVTTSGDTATLSMSIADDPNAGANSITGTTTLNANDYAVSSDITINNSGTLVAKKNIYGSATGGSITINDGGTLDASAGNICPVNASGNSFHLYLNEGGTLVVDAIAGVQTAGQARDEAQATAMFHFNGGTIYPSFGAKPTDGLRYLLNYQTAVVGEKGVIIDLSRLNRPAGYTRWVRSTFQGNVNHDPDCAGADGGMIIRGIKGEKACVYFGSRFVGSTLNGGIWVEDGATVAIGSSALIGHTVSFAPGSRLRPYSNTATIQIGNLTLGEAGATEPVFFDGSDATDHGNVVVTNEFSVLSPVVFSVCSGWDSDSAPQSGVYTALVYRASYSVDSSLFQLPAGSAGTLSASEVTLSGGDYDGWKALVVTIDNDIVVTGSAGYPTPKTVSADVSCGSIVVGGSWNGEADPCNDTSLTISGNVTATEPLYLGYNPAGSGTSGSAGYDPPHQGSFSLDGGTVSVPEIYSIYRPNKASSNDSNCRFGCEATVNGGLLDVLGNVTFGYDRSKYGEKLYSRLTVNGGRVAVGGTLFLLWTETDGAYTAPGSIVLNGGEVDVTGLINMSRNIKRYAGCKAYDELTGVWLNGGVLKAENIMMSTNAVSPQLVFNGGTYRPYGKDEANRTMQDLNKAYVSTNGAVISTANMPNGATYTIAQDLLTDPALNGATDGGLRKIGAGTLALTGVNTFTGPTVVQEGTLVVTNSDALSSSVEVAGGAVLDLSGESVSVESIKASGIVAGRLTVTGALVAADDAILSVDGSLTIASGARMDFGLSAGETPTLGWSPIAAASGTISVPDSLRVRHAGDTVNRCVLRSEGGVLYARPTTVGTVISIH